ncbi:MFS transporter [Bacillus xiapuensis]|uniref:MFS transporter n=1 Tax=Bacillus xiapuensis TaxID=2014075 RepID=UPI000C2393D7|nr:MFS transporter [Bacillus xiapuensis]
MQKAQSWLSLNFFTFFFTWGIFMPYWTAWLISEKGLTVESASTVIAAGLLVRSFSTFFIFPSLSHKFPIGTLIKLIAVCSLGLLYLFIPFDSFYAMIIAMSIFSLVYPLMMPMTESIGSIMMHSDHIDYGKSRLWGSLGYTVSLLVLGAVTAYYGEASIIYAMFAGCVLMVIAAFYYTPDSLKTKTESAEMPLRSLLKSKRFITAMVICILIQGSHAAYNSYGFIYLQHLGVSNTWSGVILNVAVLAEIIFFAKADTMMKNVRISSMFLGAAIASIIRWTLLFLFPNVWIYLFTQLLHSLTFGLAHYAFIRLLYQEFSTQEIPAAQGIYASLGMGLSTAVLTFAGGYLYKESPGLAFLGMAVVIVPAVFLSLFMKRRYESQAAN